MAQNARRRAQSTNPLLKMLAGAPKVRTLCSKVLARDSGLALYAKSPNPLFKMHAGEPKMRTLVLISIQDDHKPRTLVLMSAFGGFKLRTLMLILYPGRSYRHRALVTASPKSRTLCPKGKLESPKSRTLCPKGKLESPESRTLRSKGNWRAQSLEPCAQQAIRKPRGRC